MHGGDLFNCAHAAAHRRRTKRTRILEHFLAGFPSRQLCRRCVCLLRGSRRGLRILLRSGLRVCALIVVSCRPALCNTVSWWRRQFGFRLELDPCQGPVPLAVCGLCALGCSPTRVLHASLQALPCDNPGALVGKHEGACSANFGGKFTRRFCMP